MGRQFAAVGQREVFAHFQIPIGPERAAGGSEGLEPWKVPSVWLGWSNEPNHSEDISGYMETKLAALFEHRSQVEGDMLGFFKEWLPNEAAENGKKIGVEHAEAFRVLTLS